MSEAIYGVTVKQAEKVIIAHAAGYIQAKEASGLIQQFREAVSKVNVGEYALIVDGKDAKAVTADVVPLLQEISGLYISTPFKKKFMVQLNVGIQGNQVKRVTEGALGDLEAVSSIEEATKLFNAGK